MTGEHGLIFYTSMNCVFRGTVMELELPMIAIAATRDIHNVLHAFSL